MPDSFEGMEATLASPSENFVSHNRPQAGKETKDQKTKRLSGAGKPQSRNGLRQSHHSRISIARF